ncbi:MAG: hypothetical protein EP341_10425 [Sphingomonadales bacterium]|nr:MAG: hypothetical protein EP341_10425 [Sphingomonadales bacterium]
MEKIGGLAGALGVVLAIVAGVVNIPGLDVALIILLLGVVAGVAAPQDGAVRIFLGVLVLPAVGAALAGVPAVGGYLDAIFGNLAVAAAGVATSLVARRVYEMVMSGVKGLSGSE